MQSENFCILVWDLKTTYCMKSTFSIIGKQKLMPIFYHSCRAFSYNEYTQQQMHLQIKLVTIIKTPTYFGIKIPFAGSYKTSSSLSSSYVCHGFGPLVDPFGAHVSRSLLKGPP